MAEKITVLGRIRIRAGREDDFIELSRPLSSFHANHEGCVFFISLRWRKDPRVFVVLEQFRDRSAAAAHSKRERGILGLPPESGIRDAFRDICEEWDFALYDVVE